MDKLYSDCLILGCAYLLGSIPFGLIFAHFFSLQDPRTMGSGNIGATNMLRLGNKKIAFLTLVFDMLKGTLAVALTLWFDPSLYQLSAIAAVVGHIFPLWLRFKGGKGIATSLGVFLVLNPEITIMMVVTWAAIAFTTRYSSLAALLAVMTSPFYALLLDKEDLIFTTIILIPLILWTHRNNIKRLLSGSESKIGDKTISESLNDRTKA